jgi:DNA polymerase III epsilon subunit family exonuclease
MSVGRPTVVVMADVALPAPGIRSVPLSELDFTVVDVETTGWAPEEADITEIGAVRMHGGIVLAEFGSLVNPGTPVPQAITELTGISDQMLTSAPPVAAVLPSLLSFAQGSVLAAHNAPFDLRFLTAACAGMGRDWPGFEVLDTVRLARHLMATPQEVPDRKLATLATFFGTPVRPSHRALDDARATAVVLGELLGRLTHREGVMTLDDLDGWLAARDAEAAARHAEAAGNQGPSPRGWLARILSALAGPLRARRAGSGPPRTAPGRAGGRSSWEGVTPAGGDGAGGARGAAGRGIG